MVHFFQNFTPRWGLGSRSHYVLRRQGSRPVRLIFECSHGRHQRCTWKPCTALMTASRWHGLADLLAWALTRA